MLNTSSSKELLYVVSGEMEYLPKVVETIEDNNRKKFESIAREIRNEKYIKRARG